MTKSKADTVPLEELTADTDLAPRKPKEESSNVPSWLYDYMVKKKGQDEDLVRKIWKGLQECGFEDPHLTVLRLKTSLFSSLVGVYASAGGKPGSDANYLVEAYQSAFAKEDAS